MLLCFDIGNTHILSGVFNQSELIARFRYPTHLIGTADQFAMFMINILHVNQIALKKIKHIAISSVVPGCDFTIHHMVTQYFQLEPFVLKAGVKTGLNIKYKNPNEVGSDRIANAIGAINILPNKNIIMVDMGTATTIDLVTKNQDYLGGTIMPGMRLCMESLTNNTAKLMAVNIEEPKNVVGQTTRESIQNGLYFGQLGAIKEIVENIQKEVFEKEPATVIGTGGFSQLFKKIALFDLLVPDLVLYGLKKAYESK